MASSSSKSEVERNIAHNVQRSQHESKATTKMDRSHYLPLYKAALTGDWERASKFFIKDNCSLTAHLNRSAMTPLHIAVGTSKSIHFVEKLVEMLPPEALTLQNRNGETALYVAAVVGNTKAAKILVKKNPGLLYIKHKYDLYPLHKAAVNAHKDLLLFLLSATKDNVEHSPSANESGAQFLINSPFANESGAQLLINVIVSGFLDIALDLVQTYPKLATFKVKNGNSPLKAIARKASAFPSGTSLNLWQRFIYSCVHVKLENCTSKPIGNDIENPADSSNVQSDMVPSTTLCQNSQLAFWKVGELLAPCIKHIREKKVKHHQALQLVKIICMQINSLKNNSRHASIYTAPLLEAARLGVHEVVEEIIDVFPTAIWMKDARQRDIFKIAVLNRCEGVYNLLYQMSDHNQYVAQSIDKSHNNILHLAGRKAPRHKLNLVSGAALQMQRELQWFKEVEKFVIPFQRERMNSHKETPAMVFSAEHEDLVTEGGTWMRETANSCTITAALIATVVFAAAITVPGGNQQDNGRPVFSTDRGFILFAVSNAISLFSSIASLLMFLSILTSRYAEADFLCVLPKRLFIGLATLFVSITTMMITFSATLYLVLLKNNPLLVILVAALACVPVTLFVSSQFPLLKDVFSSTYGSGIFGKQSNRIIY